MNQFNELPPLDMNIITSAATMCEEYSIEMIRVKQSLEEMACTMENREALIAREMRSLMEEHNRILLRIFDLLDEVRNHPEGQSGMCQYFLGRLLDVVVREGIEPFRGDAGALPDPQLHEVIGTSHDPGFSSGVILSTMKSGYRQNGKIIRRSGVILNDIQAGLPQ